ncbi:hypothetical protein NBRC10512_001252 [Rhodotorula toruloides]|uniref:RHTO0S10e07448g1_1 n=2 Tax=Rhodotorula toruloides TaxID=5286 RepID=A0A061BE87_RHOTO|nr:BTB/POZ-like domain containing protein [Rhodotorula toruloides NP11]EMS22672.1 BTB/POZ-like domain containing protein [Rhodotorula toruloides NP11]CDR45277.1 RHTO0S10e07448g1_1 [Rhodotorula toruloides]
MQSHPPSNLLQPSRPTTATHSSDSTTFGSPGFGTSSRTPPLSSSSPPQDPKSRPFELLSTFSRWAPVRGTVRIRVQDQTFYAHREVLALASPFFAGVLRGGWKETESLRPHARGPQGLSKAEELLRTTSVDGPEVDPLPFPGDESLPDLPQHTPRQSGPLLSPVRPPSLDASVAASSVVEDTDEDDDELVEEWVECRLRIQEENAASFQDLLCHVYPRLDCAITWSNVEDLSRMALLFDIPSLSNACLAFLLPSAAGRPVLCMKIAEEMCIPELYREASRYILDNYAGWSSEELAVLDPSTLLKLERKRSWFLERLLKLGQVSILRDYSCQPACDDPSRCARLVDEKWRSAFAAAFRFGTPQPSIIFRSLRLLEPSLSSPALHLPYTACQTHAKLWVVDLFDRMFQLGITPARNWSSLTLGGLPASASATTSSGTWAHLRTGAGDTVATQKNTSARYFLSIEMREESASAGERRKERGFGSFGG